LTVLRGNKIVTVYFISKLLLVAQWHFSISREEICATNSTLLSLAFFLKSSTFFHITDSQYVANCLRTKTDDLPSTVKAYILVLRKELHFRTILTKSDQNLSDLLTRYTVPQSVPKSSILEEEDKLYKASAEEKLLLADATTSDELADHCMQQTRTSCWHWT
jgi:hypothetical protein